MLHLFHPLQHTLRTAARDNLQQFYKVSCITLVNCLNAKCTKFSVSCLWWLYSLSAWPPSVLPHACSPLSPGPGPGPASPRPAWPAPPSPLQSGDRRHKCCIFLMLLMSRCTSLNDWHIEDRGKNTCFKDENDNLLVEQIVKIVAHTTSYCWYCKQFFPRAKIWQRTLL